MKKLLDWIKDLLYDGVDYFIMLIIIVAVVLLINWRLDGLFTSNLSATNGNEIADLGENEEDPEIEVESPIEVENGESNQENENQEDNDKDNEEEEPPSLVEDDTRIFIPEGAFANEIANIVASNNLVESSQVFIDKAIEMNLDRSLQGGTFLIPKGSTLDEIIRIIARR